MKILSMKAASQSVLADCARLYCAVWREEPWNEDFWTPKGVLNDMAEAMSRPGFAGFIAVEGEEVRGFTWGYQVNRIEIRRIAGSDALGSLFDDSQSAGFYLAELGVSSKTRGQGIARKLSQKLISSVRGADFIVLRTDEKARPARALYESLGFDEQKSVRDRDHPGRTYWVLRL